MHSCNIDTLLGPMIAIGDEKFLYLLKFVDRPGLEREIEQLGFKTKSVIIPGNTEILELVQKELQLYFDRNLKNFTTPIFLNGSSFQQMAWMSLNNIPYGETLSYRQQAALLGKPTAYRAVANANGANMISIIIPCHRIIKNDGAIGGYAGGIMRKEWLLNHEKD